MIVTNGEWEVPLTFSGQRPGMLLYILHCTGQPLTTRNLPVYKVNSAEVKKHCSGVIDFQTTLDIRLT